MVIFLTLSRSDPSFFLYNYHVNTFVEIYVSKYPYDEMIYLL